MPGCKAPEVSRTEAYCETYAAGTKGEGNDADGYFSSACQPRRIQASLYSRPTHRKMARTKRPSMKLGEVFSTSSIRYPTYINMKELMTMAKLHAPRTSTLE